MIPPNSRLLYSGAWYSQSLFIRCSSRAWHYSKYRRVIGAESWFYSPNPDFSRVWRCKFRRENNIGIRLTRRKA